MLARNTVDELLEAIASDAPSPGSGAAAAIALAIAVACLRKAVAISARHTPEDDRLSEAAARLALLSDLALGAAEKDAQDFASLLAAERSKDGSRQTETVEDLVALARKVDAYCLQVRKEAEALAGIVLPAMANDVLAAQQLAAAAAVIIRANGAENAGLRRPAS